MQPERFKLIPAVYLFLIKDGKILLLRRFQTGYRDGSYSLPAGHLNGNESMRAALAREAKEEAGIDINPGDLEFALLMHRSAETNDHERTDIFFIAKEWQGTVNNAEPDKCDDLSWFLLDDLPQNTVDYVRVAIDCYSKGNKYCEFGW